MRRVAGEVPGFGYAFLPLSSQPAEDDLAVGPNTIENAHYRVRLDPATGAVAEWYDKELGHDFVGSYRDGGSANTSMSGSTRRRTARRCSGATSRWTILATAAPTRPGSVRPFRPSPSVSRGSPTAGRRSSSTFRRREFAAPAACSRWRAGRDRRGRLAARQGAPDRDRGGLRRFPVQPGRASVPRRRQRRPLHARGGPVTRHGARLVSARALGRRQRRRARRDAGAARRAARPPRRDHYRQVGADAGAGRTDPDVLGAAKPLDGQLQGQPGRRDPPALPADDPRRAMRRRGRGPLRRRERIAADRPPRLPADRAGDRSLRRGSARRPVPGHRQAGRGRRRRDLARPEPDRRAAVYPDPLPRGDTFRGGVDLAGRGRRRQFGDC